MTYPRAEQAARSCRRRPQKNRRQETSDGRGRPAPVASSTSLTAAGRHSLCLIPDSIDVLKGEDPPIVVVSPHVLIRPPRTRMQRLREIPELLGASAVRTFSAAHSNPLRRVEYNLSILMRLVQATIFCVPGLESPPHLLRRESSVLETDPDDKCCPQKFISISNVRVGIRHVIGERDGAGIRPGKVRDLAKKRVSKALKDIQLVASRTARLRLYRGRRSQEIKALSDELAACRKKLKWQMTKNQQA